MICTAKLTSSVVSQKKRKPMYWKANREGPGESTEVMGFLN